MGEPGAAEGECLFAPHVDSVVAMAKILENEERI